MEEQANNKCKKEIFNMYEEEIMKDDTDLSEFENSIDVDTDAEYGFDEDEEDDDEYEYYC